ECEPLLPRRRRPPDRPSRGTGPESLLGRNRRLLPGPKASARNVLRGGCSPDGTGAGSLGGPPMVLEAPPRLHLRRLLGVDARYAGEPARLPRIIQTPPRSVAAHGHPARCSTELRPRSTPEAHRPLSSTGGCTAAGCAAG